jgi:hypothetical protein
MQATLKENFYWSVIDAAVESLVHTCATCQKCKLTAPPLKNIERYHYLPKIN